MAKVREADRVSGAPNRPRPRIGREVHGPQGVVRVYPGARAKFQGDRPRQQLRPQLGTLKNIVDLSQTFAFAPPMQRLGRTAPRKLGRRNMRVIYASVCSIKGYSALCAQTGKDSRQAKVWR